MATTINADDDPKPTKPAKTAETTTNHHPATQPPSKLKRFRFTVKYDLDLLKCIRAVNVHLPTWRKTEALYEKIRQPFLKAVLTALFKHSQRPSSKTLADRFKQLIGKRREDAKRTSSASGIMEEHGEQEQLLDDLILEIDEKEESVRVEKEEQTEKEAQLVAAVKSIRKMAVMRKTNEASGSEVGDAADAEDAGDAGDSTTSSARKSEKREMSTSDDDIEAFLIEQSAKRRCIETRRIDLEQERIEIERHRAEQESERFAKLQESTDRRLDLDEKRFEVEVEERKKAIEERKKWWISWSCSRRNWHKLVPLAELGGQKVYFTRGYTHRMSEPYIGSTFLPAPSSPNTSYSLEAALLRHREGIPETASPSVND